MNQLFLDSIITTFGQISAIILTTMFGFPLYKYYMVKNTSSNISYFSDSDSEDVSIQDIDTPVENSENIDVEL
jgi:hypothetical protein